MKDLATSLRLTVVAFGACVLTTLVLYSVLDGGEWFARSLGALALVAVVGGAARAGRVPRPAIPLLQAGAVLLYLTAMYASTPAKFGWLPGEAAFRQLGDITDTAFSEIDAITPPLMPSPALTMVVIAGVAVMAIVVDALAASYRQTALAGLPLLVLYTVPAAVLPDGLRGWLFLLPAVGYLMLLVTDSRERLLRWGVPVGGRGDSPDSHGVGELSQLTRRIGLTVLSVSVAIPALAPSLSDGAFGAGGIGNDPAGGGTISTLNPLVSMRRDLVRPEDVDLMKVFTNSPNPEDAYLRAVTLDTFDGVEWRAGRREVRKFDPDLPDPIGLGRGVSRTPATTTIEVGDGLVADYVPMPYPATRLEIDGDWRLDPLTANVVSHSGADQIAGRTYSVDSLDVDPQKKDVLPEQPDGYLDPYLQLPELPPRIGQIAERETEQAASPLEKGIALQAWFRDPDNFTYDLKQRPGTGQDAITEFLDDRRGYCEQFAATMAVMARHVGVPARVNVGFTAGELSEDGVSRTISAHDAHAWPELFLHGVGWVRFEPTPGSAASDPSVPDWLAPPEEEQPEEEPGENGEEEDPTEPAENAGGGSQGQGGGGAAPTDGQCTGPECAGGPPPPVLDVSESAGVPWTRLAVTSLLILALLAVPALVRVAVRRRRWFLAARPGAAPALVAETAWLELRDSSIDLGFEWPQARTPRQTAVALTGEGGLGDAGVAALATITRTVERVRYAPGADAAADPAALRGAVDEIRRELGETAGSKARLRAVVFPRSAPMLAAAWGERIGARAIATRRSLVRTLRVRTTGPR